GPGTLGVGAPAGGSGGRPPASGGGGRRWGGSAWNEPGRGSDGRCHSLGTSSEEGPERWETVRGLGTYSRAASESRKDRRCEWLGHGDAMSSGGDRQATSGN